MARVNVYLPDDLAEAARSAGLNVSSLAQDALRHALNIRRTDDWLDDVARRRSTGVTHDAVVAAVAAAKDEFEQDG